MNFILFFFIPLVFCTNDYQLVRLWMRDVSAQKHEGITDDSLFLSVEFKKPKLMSPDWRYPISDIIEKQPKHIRARNDDDFQIYGNQHKNQQLFRFYPEIGSIFSERYPEMALNVVDEFMELVRESSIPANWKWKVKDIGHDFMFQLTHSNFEIEHILVDAVKSKPFLSNINTHISVNDIEPGLIPKTLDSPENNSPTTSEENQDIFTIENNKDELIENNFTKKKKNTTIWIIISVIVILFIISISVKIGCFPNSTIVNSNNQVAYLEEPVDENFNK